MFIKKKNQKQKNDTIESITEELLQKTQKKNEQHYKRRQDIAKKEIANKIKEEKKIKKAFSKFYK